MVDSTVDNGQWLSLADAARALGISEKTARRRVKAGQVKGQQVPTAHGQAWQVWVPSGVDSEGRVDSTGTQAATVLELVRLVGDLQSKAEAAAMWQARAELLSERLADAEQRLALTAPAETPVASHTGPGAVNPTTEPRYAPWLRRWWLLVLALAGFVVLVLLLEWPAVVR